MGKKSTQTSAVVAASHLVESLTMETKQKSEILEIYHLSVYGLDISAFVLFYLKNRSDSSQKNITNIYVIK